MNPWKRWKRSKDDFKIYLGIKDKISDWYSCEWAASSWMRCLVFVSLYSGFYSRWKNSISDFLNASRIFIAHHSYIRCILESESKILQPILNVQSYIFICKCNNTMILIVNLEGNYNSGVWFNKFINWARKGFGDFSTGARKRFDQFTTGAGKRLDNFAAGSM